MAKPRRVKATLEYTRLEKGTPFCGRLIQTQTRLLNDRLNGTGEKKETNLLVFERMDLIDGVPTEVKGNPRVGIWEDAGLRGALQDAAVEQGDVVEIVKLEKTRTSSGTEVNQYDVFQYPDLSRRDASARIGMDHRHHEGEAQPAHA